MSSEAAEHTECQHEQAGKALFYAVGYFQNLFISWNCKIMFKKCVEAVKWKYYVDVNHA